MTIQNKQKLKRIFASLSLVTLLIVGFNGHSAEAASSTPTKTPTPTAAKAEAESSTAGGVQSYSADSVLQTGTIVQLKGKDGNLVEPSNQADLGHMYGVVVDRQKLQVTISNSALKNEVYVATSGTYEVLVSSQGGVIKGGDYVTLSAIDGVAMKSSVDDTTVFGRAAAGFDGKADTLGKVTLKDKTGKETDQVALGMIAVSIDVKRNPDKKSTKTKLPDVLQRVGEAVAEKPVSAIRMYLSIAITALTIAAACVILYSGVRSSLVSIGRNPLSKKSVFRALLEIIFTSILIMIIGLFAVYLLLKL